MSDFYSCDASGQTSRVGRERLLRLSRRSDHARVGGGGQACSSGKWNECIAGDVRSDRGGWRGEERGYTS